MSKLFQSCFRKRLGQPFALLDRRVTLTGPFTAGPDQNSAYEPLARLTERPTQTLT